MRIGARWLVAGVVLACITPFLGKVDADDRNLNPVDQQHASGAANTMLRHYEEGERLTYLMKGLNEDWRYEIQGTSVVKKDPAGAFFEEYQWSNLVSNQGKTIPPAGQAFRHELSLDPKHKMVLPNLALASPVLIGPVTDMLTFYGDALIALADQSFSHAGDHKYVKWGGPNSWADGTYVLIGEDSIDFDVTLTKIDREAKTFTLTVRHVPPRQQVVKLPAEWMRTPVGDAPNNWVEIKKSGGKYIAAVGKETFDVEMTLSLVDGKILSGKLDNTVDQVYRSCSDEKLENCGPSAQHKIRRNIEIMLQ
jgi:hypothetical protein